MGADGSDGRTSTNEFNKTILGVPCDIGQVGGIYRAVAEVEIDVISNLRGFYLYLWDTVANVRVAADMYNFEGDAPNKLIPWINKPSRGIMLTNYAPALVNALEIRMAVTPIALAVPDTSGSRTVALTARVRGISAAP